MSTNLPRPNLDLQRQNNFIMYLASIGFFLVVILAIIYAIYISKLENKECDYMNTLYSTIAPNIRSLSANDPDCGYNLNDYYIKTAYNACSGGSYKNDFVNICNLKAVIKEGVRCLDFEVYSVDNRPVVATSTSDNYYTKETYNSVDFSDVMTTIKNYAFSGSTAPNSTDPILIHLRFMSNNADMYNNLVTIFKSYDNEMLGREYSFENAGTNLGEQPLLSFQNKIILIVDRGSPGSVAFLDNQELLEYVNLTSSSIFMRALTYSDVKNNPDLNELREYNKRFMSIVFPDAGPDPPNPSGPFCRDAGCQMIAMRYQTVDNFLEMNKILFDRAGYAFSLKPEPLRYKIITIPDPIQQDPALSYQTRNVSTDYYSFDT